MEYAAHTRQPFVFDVIFDALVTFVSDQVTWRPLQRVLSTGSEHQGQTSISDPDLIICIFSSGMQECHVIILSENWISRNWPGREVIMKANCYSLGKNALTVPMHGRTKYLSTNVPQTDSIVNLICRVIFSQAKTMTLKYPSFMFILIESSSSLNYLNSSKESPYSQYQLCDGYVWDITVNE